MNEEILHYLFLLLVCIIFIAACLRFDLFKKFKNAGDSILAKFKKLFIPLILVGAGSGILYKYYNTKKQNKNTSCELEGNYRNKNIDELFYEINQESHAAGNSEIASYGITSDEASNNIINDVEPENAILPEPEKKNDSEYDIDFYNPKASVGDDIRKLYIHMGSEGDNLVCNRMKFMGVQPKASQDIRAAFNKYSWQPYVEGELSENEEREWWYLDQLDAHT
jgi:hypothetical protein